MNENILIGEATLLQLQKFPIGIVFEGIGHLDPQDDATPKEAVQIMMMLATAAVRVNADYPAFVKEHHLERHFKEEGR